MTAALGDGESLHGDDEAGLRARIAAGDATAITDCYRSHATLVRRYVARLVAHHEVDDVTQAVFFELWRSARRYDPHRSLRAWLLGIARKRAIDQLRKNRPTGATAIPLHAAGDIAGPDGRELADRRASAAVVIEAFHGCP